MFCHFLRWWKFCKVHFTYLLWRWAHVFSWWFDWGCWHLCWRLWHRRFCGLWLVTRTAIAINQPVVFTKVHKLLTIFGVLTQRPLFQSLVMATNSFLAGSSTTSSTKCHRSVIVNVGKRDKSFRSNQNTNHLFVWFLQKRRKTSFVTSNSAFHCWDNVFFVCNKHLVLAVAVFHCIETCLLGGASLLCGRPGKSLSSRVPCLNRNFPGVWNIYHWFISINGTQIINGFVGNLLCMPTASHFDLENNRHQSNNSQPPEFKQSMCHHGRQRSDPLAGQQSQENSLSRYFGRKSEGGRWTACHPPDAWWLAQATLPQANSHKPSKPQNLVKELQVCAIEDENASIHDSNILGANCSALGKPRWDGSEAKRLLKLDIKTGWHECIPELMGQKITPKEFQQDCTECLNFDLQVF